MRQNDLRPMSDIRADVAGDDVIRTVPDSCLAHCLELLKEGKNVSAIKYLQSESGMGLAASKRAVERLAEGLFND